MMLLLMLLAQFIPSFSRSFMSLGPIEALPSTLKQPVVARLLEVCLHGHARVISEA